jgi:hypothetical protein
MFQERPTEHICGIFTRLLSIMPLIMVTLFEINVGKVHLSLNNMFLKLF